MGIAYDQQNAWRSASLSAIKVTHCAVEAPVRGRDEGPMSNERGITDTTIKQWLDHLATEAIGSDLARIGMTSGEMKYTVEVANAARAVPDGAVSLVYVIPYDYSGSNTTRVNLTFSGTHYSVRPEMNNTVVKAMYSAQSADEWAKAAGMKLPRVNAQSIRNSVVPDVAGTTVSSGATPFEGLRRAATRCAKSDDYGLRLHSLARIVCHSVVYATIKKPHRQSGFMTKGNVSTMLSSDTPNLTSDELLRFTWAYTHTDSSPEYRAFLLMGLRGLENYVGKLRSCYSECVTEPETTPDDVVVFVRVGGDMTSSEAVPPPGAYLTVLDNPANAYSMYYAYALSMGIGAEATAVLAQTAIGPHMWLSEATTPYKNCRPKLDAIRYAIHTNETRATCVADNYKQLVYQAAIIASAIKAGVCVLLTSFESKADVDSVGVMNKSTARVSTPKASYEVLHAVNQCYTGGNAGLAWISPFSYSMRDGLAECVRSWRQHGAIIAKYKTTPVSGLKACFSTGVSMHDAILGSRTVMSGSKYAQLLACEIASGTELSCMCEKPTRGTLVNVQPMNTRMREWQAVITITRWHATHDDKKEITDTPPSNRQRNSGSSDSMSNAPRADEGPSESGVTLQPYKRPPIQAVARFELPRSMSIGSNESRDGITEDVVRRSGPRLRQRSLSPPLPINHQSLDAVVNNRRAEGEISEPTRRSSSKIAKVQKVTVESESDDENEAPVSELKGAKVQTVDVRPRSITSNSTLSTVVEATKEGKKPSGMVTTRANARPFTTTVPQVETIGRQITSIHVPGAVASGNTGGVIAQVNAKLIEAVEPQVGRQIATVDASKKPQVERQVAVAGTIKDGGKAAPVIVDRLVAVAQIAEPNARVAPAILPAPLQHRITADTTDHDAENTLIHGRRSRASDMMVNRAIRREGNGDGGDSASISGMSI